MTLIELEEAMRGCGRTVQVICRTRVKPEFAVHICKDATGYGSDWTLGEGYTIEEAMEDALERFTDPGD